MRKRQQTHHIALQPKPKAKSTAPNTAHNSIKHDAKWKWCGRGPLYITAEASAAQVGGLIWMEKTSEAGIGNATHIVYLFVLFYATFLNNAMFIIIIVLFFIHNYPVLLFASIWSIPGPILQTLTALHKPPQSFHQLLSSSCVGVLLVRAALNCKG